MLGLSGLSGQSGIVSVASSLPPPPSGYRYLVDAQGRYVVDDQGRYVLVLI